MFQNLGGMVRAVVIIILVFFAFQTLLAHLYTPHEQISWQADDFLKGKLDNEPRTQDYVFSNGKYYWQLGPFPAVVMMPFRLFFGSSISQGIVQLFAVGLIAFFSYHLAKLKGFSPTNSFYLMLVFLFGSPLVGVLLNSYSWYFAQNIAVLLFLLLLWEFETTRRPLILGIYASLLLSTRYLSALVIFTLLIYFYLTLKDNKKLLIKQILYFVAPLALTFAILSLYNFVRFNSIFETGVGINNVGGHLQSLRAHGVFSLTHVPSNIYYYFLTSVQPITDTPLHLSFPFIKYNKEGLSMLLVAPFFLLAFRSLKNTTMYLKLLWGTVIATFVVLMVYYAPGLDQYGTRYALDFFPIFFLLLLYSFKKKELSPTFKNLILVSCAFNIFLLATSY